MAAPTASPEFLEQMRKRVADARLIAEESVLNVSKCLGDQDDKKIFWTRLYMKLVTFLKEHGNDHEHPQLKKTWSVIFNHLSVKPGFNFWSAFVDSLKKSAAMWKKKKEDVKQDVLDDLEFSIYMKLHQIVTLVNSKFTIEEPLDTLAERSAVIFWFRMFDIFTKEVTIADFSKAYSIYLKTLGVFNIPEPGIFERIVANALENDVENEDMISFQNFSILLKRFGPFEQSYMKMRNVSTPGGELVQWYYKDPGFERADAEKFLEDVVNEIESGREPEYPYLFLLRTSDITKNRAFAISVVGPDKIYNYALFHSDRAKGYSEAENPDAGYCSHDILKFMINCLQTKMIEQDFLEEAEIDALKDLQRSWKEFDSNINVEEQSDSLVQNLQKHFANFDSSSNLQGESYQIFLNQMWSKIKSEDDLQILENEDVMHLSPDQQEIFKASMRLHISLLNQDPSVFFSFVDEVIITSLDRSKLRHSMTEENSQHLEEVVKQSRENLEQIKRKLAKSAAAVQSHIHMHAMNTYNFQDHPLIFYVAQKASHFSDWLLALDKLWVLDFDMHKAGPDKLSPLLNALKLKGPNIREVLQRYLEREEQFSDEKEEKQSPLDIENPEHNRKRIVSLAHNRGFRYKTPANPSAVNDIFVAAAVIPPVVETKADLISAIECAFDLVKLLQLSGFHISHFYEQGDNVLHRLAKEDCRALNKLNDVFMFQDALKTPQDSLKYAHPYGKVIGLLVEEYTRNGVAFRRAIPRLVNVDSKKDSNVRSFGPTPLVYRQESVTRVDSKDQKTHEFAVRSRPSLQGRDPYMERRKIFVDTADQDGRTPLLVASMYSNKVLVQILTFELKVSCNAQDNDGNSALHFIVGTTNSSNSGFSMIGEVWQLEEITRLIHFCKINVNLKNKHGRTALTECIVIRQGLGSKHKRQNDYEDLAVLLLLHKANVADLDLDLQSVLIMTIFERMEKISYYRFLFMRIALVTKNFALLSLIFKGVREHPQLRPFLKVPDHSTDEDSKKIRSHLQSSIRELPSFVRHTFVWKKMEFFTQENMLHFAVQTRQIEFVEAILEYLSELSTPQPIFHDGIHDDRPHEELQQYQDFGWHIPLETIAIDDRGARGKTALHYCAANAERSSTNVEIAKLLLKHKANIIMWDDESKTALHHACSTGQLELVDLFIQNHMNPNIKERKGGMTPLHLAAVKSHWQLVVSLLRQGAQVDATCYKGHTPLKYVMQKKIDLEQKKDIADEVEKQNNTYTMEALLDNDASFENAMSESIRDAWFESTWGDFQYQLKIIGKWQPGMSKDTKKLYKERLAELMKQRASQIIVETAFQKRVHPTLIVSLILYLLFLLVCTLWVVYETNQDKLAAPYLRTAIYNSIVTQPLNFADSNFEKCFLELNNVEDFWGWARGPFLDGIYPSDGNLGMYYDGDTLFSTGYGTLYGTTKILGVPRWRQVRSKKINCDPSDFGGTIKACFAQFVDSRTEERNPFGPNLTWVWNDAVALDEYTIWGQYSFYPGSGYIMDFPPITNSSSRDMAFKLISYLQNNSWIDVKTRIVFIEFPVYSPAENQFAWVQLTVEFPLVGSTITSAEISVNRMKRYFNGADTFVWFLEVSMLFSFLIWTFHNCVKIYCFRRKYFQSFYSWFFLSMLGLYIFAMSLHLRGWNLEKKVDWNVTDDFLNLSKIKVLWMWERACLSILVLLAWFNIFEYAPVLKSISRFVVMIQFIIQTLGPFFMVFIIFIAAFSTAIYAGYGYLTQNSYTWAWSFFSRIDDTFGGAEYGGVRGYNRILAVGLQTSLFITVLLILLNLFIAILDSAYEEASEAIGDAHWARHQFNLVNSYDALKKTYRFMWLRMQDWLDSFLRKRNNQQILHTRTSKTPGSTSPATLEGVPPFTHSGTEILVAGLGRSRRNIIEDANIESDGNRPNAFSIEMRKLATRNV